MSANLLINEPPLQVLPGLAEAIGLNEAIFLQQLHYNITPRANYVPEQRDLDGKLQYWFYCPYETDKETKNGYIISWQAIFPFWSVRTIKRLVKKLRDVGVVVSTDKFNDSPWQKKLWYTINYGELNELLKYTYDGPEELAPSCQDGTIHSESMALSHSSKMTRSEIDLKETQETDLKECSEKKLSEAAPDENPPKITDKQKNKHPAIQAYREIVNFYPIGKLKDRIIDAVGEDIDFWAEVVEGWVGCGYGPRNVNGMLDKYQKREIPSTKPKGQNTNGAYTNGRTNKAGISNIGQQPDTFGPTRTIF